MFDFHALRPILKSEELTWDYETAEYEIMGFDLCLCGSPKCRKRLKGFRESGAVIQQLYGDYIAGYLKNLQGSRTSS